jgi:hypothetical protein
VLDSVHTITEVNVEKDEARQHKGGKPPRDPNAKWGVKGSRWRRDQKGQKVRQRVLSYGYKPHVSLNVQTGLITSMTHTPGNA